MKKIVKIPRILQLKSVEDFRVTCIFNNGETRVIDCKKLLSSWKLTQDDPAYPLLKWEVFKKVRVQNQTLSWKNVPVTLLDSNRIPKEFPFEIDPVILYQHSIPSKKTRHTFHFGNIIKKERLKKGLSQQELANLSGTSKTYISRLENNALEPELSTLYKIVVIGLGKRMSVQIK
jgi:DNA-binding XRE family transcriptional regulator